MNNGVALLPKRGSATQQGAAMVELSIIIPVLLIIAFGIGELGRAIYQHNALGKGADTAVRYLSRAWGAIDSDCSTLTSWTDSELVGKNLAVFGNEAGTGSPLVAGLSTTDVSVQVISGTVSGVIDPVCVIQLESSADFQGVFGDNIVPFLELGPIRLSATREMRHIGE